MNETMNFLLKSNDFEWDRWVILILILFGLITNSISIWIFSRPVFNHHVGSWYFFFLSLNNFIFIFIVLIHRFLTNSFQYQTSMNSIEFCRIISFVSTLTRGLSHYILLMATIDRYSANAIKLEQRKLNSFQIIPWVLLTIFLFFFIFSIPSPILTEFNSFDGFQCSIRFRTLVNEIYLIIQMILFVIIPPISMTIFSILTFRNRRLTGDLPATVSRCRRMEYNLTRMIFFIVSSHIILNLTESMEYLILFRSDLFQSLNLLIQRIIRIPISLSFLTPNLFYFLFSKEFRREFNKSIPIFICCSRQPQININLDQDSLQPTERLHQ